MIEKQAKKRSKMLIIQSPGKRSWNNSSPNTTLRNTYKLWMKMKKGNNTKSGKSTTYWTKRSINKSGDKI